ncbi:MAG: ECF transporter S component [Clostridia bacterium]|nr:ECF transporter S component [Clostridia bacterium]
MSVQTVSKNSVSLKKQILTVLGAVAGAIALPQLFHIAGAALGVGTSLGEIFLPMHLPVILAGIIAGPYAGAAAGLVSPLLSYLLTGMPGAVMLPFMMAELFGYGLIAGLLRSAKMPSLVKLVIIQLGGRVIRLSGIAFAVLVLNNESVAIASAWTAVVTGLPGLALQWLLIPLAAAVVKNTEKQ